MTTASLKQQVHTKFITFSSRAIVPSVFTVVRDRFLSARAPFQMFLEYGFHPRVQRWVIGQCLCADIRTLASYGVRQDGDTAYLYLLSARHTRLTLQVLQQDQESALLLTPPLSFQNPSLPVSSTNGPSSQDGRPYATLPPRLHRSSNNGKNVSLL